MQKEIRGKIRTYAIAAVLLAVILGVFCYGFGVIPQTSILTQTSILKAFSSEAELKTFLTARSQNPGGYKDPTGQLAMTPFSLAATPATSGINNPTATSDHSTTNIQVSGVDETDTVKTDGEYLYVVTGNNVSILKAYPPEESQLVSTIAFESFNPWGIFATGDRLVVLGNNYVIRGSASLIEPNYYSYYYSDSKAYAQVYDLSNKSDPKLLKTFSMSGSYFNSRMIGNYVYFIITQQANVINDTVILPDIYSGSNKTELPATKIYYSSFSDTYLYYTTFVAMNVQNTSEETTSITLATGLTSNMYVSLNNIYVTFPETTGETSIYRIRMENNNFTCEAKGTVPGQELNQFSMDEYGDYFRIVTTDSTIEPMITGLPPINMTVPPIIGLPPINMTFEPPTSNITGSATIINMTGTPTIYVRQPPTNNSKVPPAINITEPMTPNVIFWGLQRTNLYVLNMDMSVVGKLENISAGENLHSSRFIGNRCYLVTFQNTDPLFVIDLSNPTAPAVLGELKIPGYSDYLHPYDDTHIIGVGKDTIVQEGGTFSLYQGIKVSIFDVSNVSNPIQLSKYVIGDRGSLSPVLTDHKAFLFDKAKNLLVIPVTVAEINASQYPEGTPSSTYGTAVWQGAYVFNITLTDGLVLRGNITHAEGPGLPQTDHFITRSLFIDNVLYTVSDAKLMLNNLEDLTFIKEINLN